MALASQNQNQVNSGTLRSEERRVTLDPNILAYVPTTPLTGDLRIVGGLSRPPGSATAAGPATTDALIELWIDIFKTAHPSVRVHTALYGSGIAAGALLERAPSSAWPLGS